MDINKIDLNLLRVLEALLIERSTTKAATRLNMSQPAVSAALSRLRSQFDEPLFERHASGLTPTAFALSIEPDIRDVLERIESVFSASNAFQAQHSTRTFKLAASDYFADFLMPRLSKRFREEAPHAKLQLTPLDPQDHLNSLERFKTDLIIFLSLPVPEWMRAKDVFHSRFRILVSAQHSQKMNLPLTLADYCQREHALYSPSGETRTWVDAELEKLGYKRNIVATTSTFHSLAKIVEKTDLIATVPELSAQFFASHYKLDVLEHPLATAASKLMMAWHYRSDKKAEHRWFRDLVNTELEELQALIP